METKQYVYFKQRVRTLKEGVNLKEFLAKYPEAYAIKKPPTITTLNKWSFDGVAKALDGCRVEPDGVCPHGKPSWLMALGYI